MISVYILQSEKDNGYYIGITKDIEKRLKAHNNKEVQSTKNRAPFNVVHFEEFQNYYEARNREKEIKSYKGGNNFHKLIGK